MISQAIEDDYKTGLQEDSRHERPSLRLKRLGIDTYLEPVIYMRGDCHVCRSEGFEAQSRVCLTLNSQSIIATLNVVTSDQLLAPGEAGLSEIAWRMLEAQEGDTVELSHPIAFESLDKVRAKIYGEKLDSADYRQIMRDITSGLYSNVHLSSFITACSAADNLDKEEIISLTKAMIERSDRLSWGRTLVMDKHCVGGLPGNRTTLLVVPIVTAFGLVMPKISSKAITSPAGTADAMEALAPVDLDLRAMRRVVEREGGCIVWGGSAHLSPSDYTLIRVERALDIDGEKQMIASVLSKEVAAGSTHVVIDIPVGQRVKVRSLESANALIKNLTEVGRAIGLAVRGVTSDGSQPVGYGIGPALEARDILAVLAGEKSAPQDLRERALILAGHVIEMSGRVLSGDGREIAQNILDDGRAWRKFIDICEAQGGFREPPRAKYTHVVTTLKGGAVISIDNRNLARVAKLAGAPKAQAAGLELHTLIGMTVEAGQPIYTIHAETRGELNYALDYVRRYANIVSLE